jgi:hypothetical protein
LEGLHINNTNPIKKEKKRKNNQHKRREEKARDGALSNRLVIAW